MDIKLLASKVFYALRRDGLTPTLHRVLTFFTRRRGRDNFDLEHGTDTGGIEPLWKFRISSPNRRYGVRYQATDEQELLDALRLIHEKLETFTFIDLGCGKGRTLLVAARLGFKRVIGVEFARELVEIASANLAKLAIMNAAVEHADAADFRFPRSDVVLYLYNPFSQEVVRQVVAKLQESCSRRLYIIYKVPECAEVLDSSGFLSRLGYPPSRPYIQVWQALS